MFNAGSDKLVHRQERRQHIWKVRQSGKCGNLELLRIRDLLHANVFHAAGRDGVPAAVVDQGSQCAHIQQNMVLVSALVHNQTVLICHGLAYAGQVL